MSHADLILADAYRDWFTLCARERHGDLPSHDEVRAARAAIRVAETLSAHPHLVYEVTKGQYWVDTGEEP